MGWNPAPGPQRGADALPEALSAAHDCRRDRRGEISGAHFVSSREGTWDAFASTPSPSFLPPLHILLSAPLSDFSTLTSFNPHIPIPAQSRSRRTGNTKPYSKAVSACRRSGCRQHCTFVMKVRPAGCAHCLPSYRSSLPTANSSIAASTLFPFPSSPKQATAHISTTALESAKCRIPQSEPHLPPHSLVR